MKQKNNVKLLENNIGKYIYRLSLEDIYCKQGHKTTVSLVIKEMQIKKNQMSLQTYVQV